MPTETGALHLATPDDRAELNRWRLGFFIALSWFVFIALADFAQESPAKALTRPTGPLPAINILRLQTLLSGYPVAKIGRSPCARITLSLSY